MSRSARRERLQIKLTDEELAALNDWRFDKRMPSRASAVPELLKRGLAAEGVVVRAGSPRATSAFSGLPKRRSNALAGAAAKPNSSRSSEGGFLVRPMRKLKYMPGGEKDGRIFDGGWRPGVDHEQ